jgi:hypothetical protein
MGLPASGRERRVLTIRGGNDVVAEEVGEDLTELDLEVGRGGSGGGGGGGGGGDELSKLGDEGGAAAHPLSPFRSVYSFVLLLLVSCCTGSVRAHFPFAPIMGLYSIWA